MMPPPNVTANLHMGHGLNNTIQDAVIRFERMRGRETLWLPGTDHAGIATQNVVERALAAEGKTRFDLGREAFVTRVWAHVHETGATILDQLKAIGASCDWGRTYFTLDEGLSRAVREVFVQLYGKGLIYRGNYIINWCPRCLTALSNEEAEKEERDGHLWHLKYPLAGGGFLTVATTRPETMLGDTAVAVHPADTRYAPLIGTTVRLPLADRDIPIVGDDAIDPAFGTGAVKVTPAHDPLDFEIGRRHGLASIDILTPDAHLNENVPERFRGLTREAARKRVVREFEALGLLDKVEPHRHAVAHCYRCGTVVEPRLSEQWFVKMAPLAAPALAAYRDGTLRFIPERRGTEYAQWMEGIRDWCISRQLWWGHRIPVWYCDAPSCGHVSVSRTDLQACLECGGPVRQDEDVLDTWFSSWLVPFSSLGWPAETPDLETFYPGDTLVTAPEILFFWVSRMIMAGLEFQGEVPFRTIYLHGTVRDTQHRKMSKSLGNGIDPLEVVERYGADALRYTVISGMAVGTDLILDPADLETSFGPGRNFANKLWNAGRFLLGSLTGPTRPLAGAHRTAIRPRGALVGGSLDYRPVRRHRARRDGILRAFPPQRRRGGGPSLPLERPGRLVHRTGQAAPLRRPARRRRRARRPGPDLRRGPAAPPPGDALHHGDALEAPARTAGRRLHQRGPVAPAGRPRDGPGGPHRLRAGPAGHRRGPADPGRVRRAAGTAGAALGVRPAPGARRRTGHDRAPGQGERGPLR